MNLIRVGVLVVLTIITYYSLRPPSSGDLPTNDKIGHGLAYLVLCYVVLLLFKEKKQIFYGVLFCLAYGVFMEFLQGFVPGRSQSFADIIANSTGVVIGLLLPFRERIRKILVK